MKSKKNLLKPPGANMVLLDHNGNPQMYLRGGELVISRVETKKLIEMAKSASSEDDFINLGKYMHQVRMKQRARKKEYVKN
jgi:hypothetical protein